MLFFPIKIAMKLLSLLFSVVVVYLAVTAVQVILASRASASPGAYPSAAAIVVLGASAPGGTPGQRYTDRLETGASLYGAHLASRVILTGDDPSGSSTSVTSAGATWLEGHGIPSGAVTTLPASSAVGGLRGVDATLPTGSTVLVVTDAIDVLWTRGAAKSAGLSANVVPAAQSKVAAYSEVGPLWRETSGVAVGRIIGDLRASWAGS